jgi:transposase
LSKNITARRTIGIDQGDRWSHLCVVDRRGDVVEEGRVATTRAAYRKHFGKRRSRGRVVLEAGPHSPWSSRLLVELGYEVGVANPRRVKLISQAEHKTDRVDAEMLARLGRSDPKLLAPIEHGCEDMQRDRSLLVVREGLVRCRGRLIQQARGLAKALGEPLPKSTTRAFAQRVREAGSHQLFPGLEPLLETIEELTVRITALEREIDQISRERYPVTQLLQQIAGVGPLTSLAFVLKVEDPGRFAKSREVGPFVSLVPKQSQSGKSSPQLGVPRRGDAMVRRLLVQAAQYVLGPFGPDTELRRAGLRIAEAGGRGAKKRAVVAVARRLAVVMHRLWVTGEAYQPLGYGKSESLAA